MSEGQKRTLARQVKQACLEAAREGFEDAELSGLCREGCIEAALSAIEMVDLEPIVEAKQVRSS